MSARLLLPVALAAVVAASPALACVIAPPATSAAGRAEAARQAQAWQARLDGAEAVFVARVSGKPTDLGVTADLVRPLRGQPPASIRVGPRSDCDPIWKGGDRLVVYANRVGARWTVLRIEPDTPTARAAVHTPAPP